MLKELPRIAVKFANMLFLLVIVFSLFVVIRYIYGLFYPFDGPYGHYLPSVYKYYFKNIIIGAITATIFSFGLKRFSNNLKVSLSLLLLTTGISVYGFETYLNFLKKNPYNITFGEDRFIDRSYYGGTYAKRKNNSNYTTFSVSGMDFIVINLDWKPNVNELKWAENLLQTYSKHRAIVTSHYILGGDFKNQQDNDSFSLQGQNIFHALKDNPNLFLMLSAHITPNAENIRTDIYINKYYKGSDTYYDFNDNYHEYSISRIYSLLANYQHRPNGGNGWLRILQFSPVNEEIRVKTYSPFLNKWETDENSEFTLMYNMSNPVLSSIEDQTTNSSVAKENFSIIIIPDTQYYSENFPFIFNVQTQWIVDNRDAWNIVYVAHTGDIVNNPSSIPQWRNANRAMSILEDAVSERFPNGIPYGVVPGNHDLLKKEKIKKKESTKKKITNLLKLKELRYKLARYVSNRFFLSGWNIFGPSHS